MSPMALMALICSCINFMRGRRLLPLSGGRRGRGRASAKSGSRISAAEREHSDTHDDQNDQEQADSSEATTHSPSTHSPSIKDCVYL